MDVTDVASVKGLEFDYVVVPDASARAYPDTDDARRRLHVAVTRAAHQLWIAAPGTPSPLLGGARGRLSGDAGAASPKARPPSRDRWLQPAGTGVARTR